MPHGKNKKKQFSKRSVHQTGKAREVNPFELKVNRQKHEVLGRKMSKTDKGIPGLSRSKAIKKRTETLLVEYKKLGRGNRTVDHRIGESDPTMSFDEKMAKRFALERQRHPSETSKNLLDVDDGADSTDLTHFGRSLSEVENFKDPVVSDSDEDSDSGRISAKVVGEEHFGGFLTKVDSSTSDEKKKTWKEKMEEIISKSKKAKYDRHMEKEKAAQATKTIDAEWKELQMLVSAVKKNRELEAEAAAGKKKEAGEYDVVVRQLQFEMKSKPCDRLKTEEEIAKEEKEKLEALEAERIRRMHGYTETDSQTTQMAMSADDLNDGLAFDHQSSSQDDGTDQEDDEDENDEGSQVDNGDDDDDDENGSEDNLSDIEQDDDDDKDDDSNADDDDGDGDSLSARNCLSPPKKRVRFGDTTEIERPEVMLSEEEMAAARAELPYTFTAPECYEDLLDLFGEHSHDDCLVIIDRLRKCHHPSLAEGNKAKLEVLFDLLLRHFGEVTRCSVIPYKLLDGLTRHLYDLTQMSAQHAGRCIAELMADRYKEFTAEKEERRGKPRYPEFDLMLYFRLVSVLFPTSDRRHPVVTLVMLFMSHILTQCPVSTTKDVSSGLFICSLYADYVSLSKRFIPEVINYLVGVLFLAAYKVKGRVIPVVPPFKTYSTNRDLLKLTTDASEITIKPVEISRVFGTSDSDYLQSNEFKVQSLAQCLRLLHTFTGYYSDLPSYHEIFSSVRHYARLLPLSKYPDVVKSLHSELMTELDRKSPYTPLVRPVSRPQPLKQLEPRITENFDGRKKRTGGSKESLEKQRLLHKYKREMKGTIREIRKDTQFIARQKLNDQIQRDAERKRKVRELVGQLAQQEGECKAFKKAKRSNS